MKKLKTKYFKTEGEMWSYVSENGIKRSDIAFSAQNYIQYQLSYWSYE